MSYLGARKLNIYTKRVKTARPKPRTSNLISILDRIELTRTFIPSSTERAFERYKREHDFFANSVCTRQRSLNARRASNAVDIEIVT